MSAAVRMRPWQRKLIRLAAGALLIAGILWFVPFHEVADALRRMDPRYLLAGFVMSLAASFVQAFQLWVLLRRVGVPLSPGRVFATNMAARFYGQFLPSELMTGAVKLYRLAGPHGRWGEVVAAQACFRVVNMLMLVLLGLAFWAVEMPAGAGRWAGVVMGGLAAALIALHMMLASPRLARAAAERIPRRRLAWVGGTRLAAAERFFATAAESYQRFGSTIAPVAAIAIARHALGIVSFGLVARSVGVELSYLTIGWVRVVLQGLMMLPITVSGIGVREGSLIVLLQTYGIPASQAVALALALFLVTLANNAVGGLFELWSLLRPQRAPAVGGG